MKKYFVILVAVTMAVTTDIFAQSSDFLAIGREFELLEDSTVNYLMPVYQLKINEPSTDADFQSRWNWIQMYPTYLSRLTSERKSTLEAINEFRRGGGIVSSESALLTNDDVLNYLIKKSKDERVVMINENHFAPHHRILVEILMDSLYNYGFRYLAMEAVSKNDTVLNKRGFATTYSGFYTREPMMSNLIRSAIARGYYVFGYDDNTDDREKNQASNIFQKTIAKDSTSKVLVLAGFQHIDEREGTRNWAREGARNWMAREFYLLTEIDPLTINQQSMIVEDVYLMFRDTTVRGNRSSDIFIANNIDYDTFATKSGYTNYDIVIPLEIAEQAQTETLLYVVSVFKADEYRADKTAIPMYNYVLNGSLSNISIKLPYDAYFYVIKDRYGKIVHNGTFDR